MIQAAVHGSIVEIICRKPEIDIPGHLLVIALATDSAQGSAVVPFGVNQEGSTVFLPFRANRIYFIHTTDHGVTARVREWAGTVWGAIGESNSEIEVGSQPGELTVRVPMRSAGLGQLRLTAYAKDLRQNNGWGSMFPDEQLGISAGLNDKVVQRYFSIDFSKPAVPQLSNRLGSERQRIYQLLPRLFGNTNETRKPNGTLAENGCGKFRDINDTALSALREMGITHLWLTGVLQQATATDYSGIGAPADDPDLLKGLAGSPYAIKDYFDLCPDYAVQPAERFAEFQTLLDRIHAHGMKVIIDFVPNHVARSYQSDVRPGLTFGIDDDRTKFFDARNNFFYLRSEDHGHGPPLLLPTVRDGHPVSPTCCVLGSCDGNFDGEADFGRVTGNNVISWTPSLDDWYETVKLNYGFDFTTGAREYPHGGVQTKQIPDTWLKMDSVLEFWQQLGVDGFRCDMAHMVPPEFWSWAIGRARARRSDVWFMAEAYDNDPAKVPGGDPLLHALNDHRGNVMFDLLSAGFDSVYDDPSYKKLKAIYDGSGWANDLDQGQPHEFIFQNSLRYAENHDEVRLAGKYQWGGVGMEVGRAVTSILFALGRGPVMLYHGQEVGEPAEGSEGFSGDNARTTIFDYWSMPEFTKWVNDHRYDGGRLSLEQQSLRAFHSRLMRLCGEPAFRDGDFIPLNPHNIWNDRFGRLPGESASGHWLYAFLRASSVQNFLVATNLHPKETLRDVRIHLPREAIDALNIGNVERVTLFERLSVSKKTEFTLSTTELTTSGVLIPELSPLTAYFLEFIAERDK